MIVFHSLLNPLHLPYSRPIVRLGQLILRKHLRSREQGTAGAGRFVDSQSQNRELGHPPAHREKNAMNGAQLFIMHGGSSELMTGPPAKTKSPFRFPTWENLSPITAFQPSASVSAVQDLRRSTRPGPSARSSRKECRDERGTAFQDSG